MQSLRSLLTLLIAATLLLLVLGLAGCSDAGAEATPTATVDAAAAALANDPTLALAPARGYAGVTVNVRGNGWPPAKVVLIKLADVQGHSPVLVAATVDANGQFVAQFAYPSSARWLQSGVQTVIAQTQDNQVQVGASFLVTPPEGAVTPTSNLTPPGVVSGTTSASATPTATLAATMPPPTATPLTAAPVPTATIALSAGGLAAAASPMPSAEARPTAAPLAVPARLPTSATLESGFRIRFLGVTQHADGSSTWRYSIEKATANKTKKLQAWEMELPSCVAILDASPAGWEVVSAKEQGAPGGIRWKIKGNDQQGEFGVTLSGPITPGTVHVTAKAPKVEGGMIVGPHCQ